MYVDHTPCSFACVLCSASCEPTASILKEKQWSNLFENHDLNWKYEKKIVRGGWLFLFASWLVD